MLDKLKSKNDFDSGNFLIFIYIWRIPVFIITLAAFFASIIISSPLFITPKYKSTVIMFPVMTNSISKALLSENYGQKQDILEFGEDEQAEQMLQILNSNRIRDKIIKKYNLMEHYGIDTNSSYKFTRLYNTYENNIIFRRTEYMAVKITVYDKDAQLAADIANNIADILDSTKNAMQKERAIKAFSIVESNYLKLKHEVQMMEDSLSRLRELGVHDYESQAEMINQQLAIEIARGNTSGVKALEGRLEILAKYGGPYVSIRDELEHEKKQLSLLKSKFEEAKVDAEEVLPQKFIVSYAYKAERKSYPDRWVIVLISTVSAFILSIILISVYDSIAAFKKKSPDASGGPWLKTFGNTGGLLKNIFTISGTDKNSKREIQDDPEKEERNSYDQLNEKFKFKINMESQFYQINLLRVILRWKVHLAVIAVAIALLAAVFSSPWFITPKFKSYAVIYPSNISPYSEESETEQMLQVLQSKDIRDSIMIRFNLARHYEIDSSYKYFYSTLSYLYSQNVHISKTPYEGVSIEVFDKDPGVASDIANAIIDYYNIKIRTLHENKFNEVVKMFQRGLNKKRSSLDSLIFRLHELASEYGLLEYDVQAEEISKGFLKTIDGAGALHVNTPELLKLKKNFESKGGELILLVTLIENEAIQYSDMKYEYEKAYMDFDRKFTYVNEITRPYPADKKAYPIRWLIVLVSVLAGTFLAFIIALILENKRLAASKST
ncbi:MAG: hypothetical protein JXA03_01585 [Bacteroidales bacterium]|nr:hypothetical protein [Bacteroidales bacterium]